MVHDLSDMYDLARISGWELYNLHDLGPIVWVGSVLLQILGQYNLHHLGPFSRGWICTVTDRAQHLMAAGWGVHG